MLIPLKKDGDNILYGEPISLDKNGKKYIELINNPKKFFKVYSSDFGNFLDNVYEKNNFSDIDVSRLIELGSFSKKNGNYEEAVFYFEAALQIEKHPEVRFQILNKLFSCYLKTGKKYEAKIIAERFKDIPKEKFYNLFPEKGF
jgi:tetratricopeptide (TPR) repeat protein